MKLPLQFGPYQLLERVSVGGMAEVYKAKEYGVEGFERTVAVKRILPHVAEDEEFIAMFKDEAKIAVQLSHGNIAQIYNLGNHEDSFYIALEYVAGRDLRAIFQRQQQQSQHMPIAQACYIIMKVCEGLDYAHNKKDKYGRELNIVHRDVSPPNILVSYEGEVKLIDFGVAKAAGRASKTQAGILKGKFGYMSPEQVRGLPLDRRSDVFSVGVVLWEVLTSQRLFQGETDFATLEKVRAVEVPRPSEINEEIVPPLEDIVFKALAREPDERYQSAIELHDELQAFMFAQGLFYSRKDLATWMRKQYAKEIELEKESASKSTTAPPPPPPKGKKPPPPPSAGTKPPPPPPRKAEPPPAAPIVAQGLPPSDGPLAMGKPPMPPGSARKRSPTLMAPAGRPAALPVPAGLPRPGAMNPKPAASLSKPGGKPLRGAGGNAARVAAPSSDFDWDDDELETRLFDGESQQSGPVQPPPSLTPRPGAGPKVEVARGVRVIQPRPGAQPMTGGQAAPGSLAAAAAAAGATVPVQPDRSFSSSSGTEWERPVGTPRTGLIIGLGGALVAAIMLLAVVVAALGNNEDKAKTEQVAAAVDPKAAGSLTLNITPGDALVLVDGQMIGGTSPFIVTNLPAGSHKVSVTKEGFLPFEREVMVQSGASVVIPHQLAFRDVILELDTTPTSAKVDLIIDGQRTPLKADTHKITRRPDATYEIEASASGYVTSKVPLVFTGEPAQRVPISLVRDSSAPPPPSRPTRSSSSRGTRSGSSSSASSGGGAKTATLAIGVAPGNKPAKVSVDGSSIGTTPKIDKVSPGTHTIRCSWADGATDTHTVSVSDGGRQVVRCSP